MRSRTPAQHHQSTHDRRAPQDPTDGPCRGPHGVRPVIPLAFAVVPGPWPTAHAPEHLTDLPLRGAACSHVGCVRPQNEDAWMARPEVGLFAVADGMGGHAAGEVAAAWAIADLQAMASEPIARLARTAALREAIEDTNGRIFEGGYDDPTRHRMGTTLAALWLQGERATLAHVGDSRIYRLRDGQLTALTLDHNPVGDAVRAGFLSRHHAATWRPTPLITRHLGAGPTVEVELATTTVQRGDQFLLCTDGLTDRVPHLQMQRIMRHAHDPADAARALTLAALDAGGADNVTVLVVAVG